MEDFDSIVRIENTPLVGKNLNPEWNRRVLSAIKIDVSTIVSKSVLDSMALETQYDVIASQLTAQLTGTIYANQDVIEKTLFVPKTWWDHLKLTLRNKFKSLGWLTVVVDQINAKTTMKRVCPHLKGKYDENEHLHFLDFGSEIG